MNVFGLLYWLAIAAIWLVASGLAIAAKQALWP